MNIVEFIQCNPANYTRGREGRAVDTLAIHYTATSASGHNNLVYFSRPGANASAHLFVDKDGSIRQSVGFGDTAWAVGNWNENLRSISVEVVSAGEDFTEAQIRALSEIYNSLKKTYGITRVVRHYDITGKRCPAPYVDNKKWSALHSRIVAPVSAPDNPINDAGLWYRAHVTDLGWLDAVHDGQMAGTEGKGLSLQALKMQPPEGLEINVKLHVAEKGWVTYKGIKLGEKSGTGSNSNDPIIGTVGQNLPIEALECEYVKNDTGKRLRYQVHIADYGTTDWVDAPYTAGTVGIGKPIEWVRFALV